MAAIVAIRKTVAAALLLMNLVNYPLLIYGLLIFKNYECTLPYA